MRILFVSQELPPETGWGGIGTYVDILSEALVEKGVDVHVLSVVEGQPASTKEVAGVIVHRHPLPRVRGAGRLPPQAWRRTWLPVTVARLIRRLGLVADVVECPEWSAEGLALALRGTFPLVVRLHSGARQLFPFNGQGSSFRGLDGRLSAWLEETSARRANVVVGSRSSLDEVGARMRLDRRAVHAISYPVRLPPPSPMPNSGGSQVTFLGRFEPRKGPELVLRAAPKVLAVVPGARFAFVGRDATSDGAPSSAAWLRCEADKLGIGHAVEVREEFGRAAVQAELKRSTVCAVPSRWESFGYLVAEAAAIGRPVVASAIPPFQELVEDRVTGRIASLHDTQEWADALIELLTDKRRACAMGRAAANRIAQISGPAHIADQTLAAYEHAIERWRRAERAADG